MSIPWSVPTTRCNSQSLSFNILLHRKYGEDHADEDRADESGDEEEQQWLREGHGSLQLAIQVPFGDSGDAHEFLVQATAFFRDRDHLPHGAGKQALAFAEADAQLPALLDTLDGLGHGVHQDLV